MLGLFASEPQYVLDWVVYSWAGTFNPSFRLPVLILTSSCFSHRPSSLPANNTIAKNEMGGVGLGMSLPKVKSTWPCNTYCQKPLQSRKNIMMLSDIPHLSQTQGNVTRSSAGKHKAFNWELNTMEHFRGCRVIIIIFSVPGGARDWV